jgi:hypothetical protein
MTKADILLEMLEDYIHDPAATRATAGAKCVYETADGRRCGLGRSMINPGDPRLILNKETGATCGAWSIAAVLDLKELDEALKPQYRGHHLEFWEYVQNLHDSPPYWNRYGLTDAGKTALTELIHSQCYEDKERFAHYLN